MDKIYCKCFIRKVYFEMLRSLIIPSEQNKRKRIEYTQEFMLEENVCQLRSSFGSSQYQTAPGH